MHLLHLALSAAAVGIVTAQGPNAGQPDDNGYVDPNAYYHESDVIASMRNCTENLHVCPDSCYFHGRCNEDGSCTCDQGRTGDACELQTCETCGYVVMRFDPRLRVPAYFVRGLGDTWAPDLRACGTTCAFVRL